MKQGILYGVSVGPGDPELLTLKAVRILGEADVVAVPSSGGEQGVAHRIVERYLAGKELLECPTPMTHDEETLREAHEATADAICAHLAAGRTVAYVCLGDISIYSSYSYIQDFVRARGFETEIVPGVPSFCAAAAALSVPLCQAEERLIIAPSSGKDLDELLDMPGNKVLMKLGRGLGSLRQSLANRGLADHASLVEQVGMPGERVTARLADADEGASYLSLVIVRER